MVDTAVIYGAERAVAEIELREALEFEIALANVSMSLSFHFKMYNHRTCPM